jgi:hypothetical protein
VGPEVKQGHRKLGPLNKGCERRCRTLPAAENANVTVSTTSRSDLTGAQFLERASFVSALKGLIF